MFSKKAKIFPVDESDTDTDTVTDDGDDMDRLCQVVYSYLLELEPDSSYRNKFGVIDLNFDEFEIKLEKLEDCSHLLKKTYAFKVCGEEDIKRDVENRRVCCSSLIRSYDYDGIVSNHCEHNVAYWEPMFYKHNHHIEWFAFLSKDNVHYRDKFGDDYWAEKDKNDY